MQPLTATSPRAGFLRSLAVAAAVSLGTAAHAQQEATLALPQQGLGYLNAFVAADAGLWRDLGLNVKIVYIPGTGAVSGVLSKSVDFANISAGSVARVASRGQNVEILGNMVGSLIIEIVLRKDVAEAAGLTPQSSFNDRVKALSGKTVSVSAVNTVIHNYLKVVAKKGGLDIDRDMQLAVSSNAGQNSIVSLETKRIHAMVQSPPWPQEAVSAGFAVPLIGPKDVTEFAPYGYTLLISRPDHCKTQRDICTKMAKGLALAAKYIHDNPAGTLEILKARFPAINEASLRASYDLLKPATLNPPVFEPAAMANAIKFEIESGTMQPGMVDVGAKIPFTNEFVKP